MMRRIRKRIMRKESWHEILAEYEHWPYGTSQEHLCLCQGVGNGMSL